MRGAFVAERRPQYLFRPQSRAAAFSMTGESMRTSPEAIGIISIAEDEGSDAAAPVDELFADGGVL